VSFRDLTIDGLSVCLSVNHRFLDHGFSLPARIRGAALGKWRQKVVDLVSFREGWWWDVESVVLLPVIEPRV
jgi:hypothetical protein